MNNFDDIDTSTLSDTDFVNYLVAICLTTFADIHLSDDQVPRLPKDHSTRGVEIAQFLMNNDNSCFQAVRMNCECVRQLINRCVTHYNLIVGRKSLIEE